jgi:Pyridoxamine 5'-phosphate oxidase
MRPNDPLVGHYVAHSLVMRLATVSAQGRPSLTPIWLVKLDGRLISSTAATTVAARNVAAELRVTVLLDGETAGRSEFVLRLRATAVIHRGLLPLGVLARFGVKYYLSPRGLRSELSHTGRWRLRTRYYAQSDAVWLTVEPTAAELIPVPRRVLKNSAAPARSCQVAR